MPLNYYAELEDDGRVLQCISIEDPVDGPPSPVFGDRKYRLLADPVDWSVEHSPTASLYWKYEDDSPKWVELADLVSLKARKNDEINAARLSANQSYFDFQSKQIACDAVSMLDIQSANAEIALTHEMPSAWPGGWKAVDNTYVAIPDVATWTLFIKAMVSRGTAHFQHAQTLKQQLAAATTPEAVAAIIWGIPTRGY